MFDRNVTLFCLLLECRQLEQNRNFYKCATNPPPAPVYSYFSNCSHAFQIKPALMGSYFGGKWKFGGHVSSLLRI